MTIDYAKVEGFLRGLASQAEVDAETNLEGTDQAAMYVAAARIKLVADEIRRATQTGQIPREVIVPGTGEPHQGVR